MTASPSKRYEHFDVQVENSEPVVSGVGKSSQTHLKGTVNKWVRLARLPSESDKVYNHRLEEDKRKMSRYRSHLLFAKRFDSRGSRLVALATRHKRIGYGWMPVLGDEPIDLKLSKAIAIWLNSTLGRISLRRVTARKIEYPQFSPVAFNGVPFVNIDDSKIVSTLVSAYDETCNEVVPQFRDGRVPIREIWDDAVSLSLNIERDLIARCADKLAQDPFVSKESFYESM